MRIDHKEMFHALRLFNPWNWIPGITVKIFRKDFSKYEHLHFKRATIKRKASELQQLMNLRPHSCFSDGTAVPDEQAAVRRQLREVPGALRRTA